jgi:hypothetical protein
MCSHLVLVLLPLIARAYTKTSVNNTLGELLADKLADGLVDRTIASWLFREETLEDSMHAKPVAQTGKNLMSIISTPNLPTFMKDPSKAAFLPAPWKQPLKHLPKGSSSKVDLPGVQVPNDHVPAEANGRTTEDLGYLGYLGRFLPLAGSSPKKVTPQEAAQVAIPDLHIPLSDGEAYAKSTTKENLEYEPQEAASISIAGLTPRGGSDSGIDTSNEPDVNDLQGQGYHGRLAPFPGVVPELDSPRESASRSIAELVPTGSSGDNDIEIDANHIQGHMVPKVEQKSQQIKRTKRARDFTIS